MKITILTVGTTPPATLAAETEAYLKRLPRHISVSWRYIAQGRGGPERSKHEEAKSLETALDTSNYVVLLDEKGSTITSERFSKILFDTPRDCIFIIGGAYGVADSIREKADFVWSLSPLVFPHQIVRLLVTEQLYRAHCIHTGHPYHHA